MNFSDLFGQLEVLQHPSARFDAPLHPLIIAAAAYAKSLAEHLDWISILHFFSELVPLEGPSATMLSVFLPGIIYS
jgi:hypothetical protein